MRRALVTGASRGTGRAIAEELLARGCEVISLGRTEPQGLDVRHISCDFEQPDDLNRAVESLSEVDRLDVLVTGAATRRFSSVRDVDATSLRRAVEVNFVSVLLLCRAMIPALATAQGSIVLMGSHAGTRFFEDGIEYAAPKAALRALAETLLLEERGHGIRTTLISPGAISNREGDASPLKMLPSSVARLVSFVALDMPSDAVIGEVELRPAKFQPSLRGIARLQEV